MSEGLDQDLRRLIEELNALDLPPFSPQNPEQARETYRVLARAMGAVDDDGSAGAETVGDRAASGVEAVVDRSIDGRAGPIPIRIYEPAGRAFEPLPVVVLMHGGGWMVGDLDTHDATARAITTAVGVRVVSVHYRRAPEHPFPAAVEDCLDVVETISSEAETLSVSVAGDSAGGNLAAAVAIGCRDRGGPSIAAQLLIYPALDPHRRGGSSVSFADGYLLTTADMAAYDDAYLQTEADRYLPLASPLRAPDLTGLPPAIVATAGFDPLLDEGRAYAHRLIEADVSTTYLCFPALTHGWLEMTRRVPAAARARTIVLEAFASLIWIQAGHRADDSVVGFAPTHQSAVR